MEYRPIRPLVRTLPSESLMEHLHLQHQGNQVMHAFDADVPMRGLWQLDIRVNGHTETRPDPITKYRVSMTKHDAELAKAGRLRRFNARSKSERAEIVARRAHNRPTLVRQQECWSGLNGRTEYVDGGIRWDGFTRVAMSAPRKRQTRKVTAVKVARAIETGVRSGARGPAVSWWTMTAGTVSNRWTAAPTTARDTAQTIIAILTTSHPDTPIELADGYTVTVDQAQQVWRGEHRYSMADYARRAALAGLAVE